MYTILRVYDRVAENTNYANYGSSFNIYGSIADAINYLSNFFQLEKIDASISTVASQNYIDKPDKCLKVVGDIKIGDDYYKKKEDSKSLQEIEDFELLRYEEKNDGKIYLYPTPTSVKACRIHFKSAFSSFDESTLDDSEVLDIPDNLIPLLITLSTWFTFNAIAIKIGTQREAFPDMDPKEAEKTAKSWETQFEKLYEKIESTN